MRHSNIWKQVIHFQNSIDSSLKKMYNPVQSTIHTDAVKVNHIQSYKEYLDKSYRRREEILFSKTRLLNANLAFRV